MDEKITLSKDINDRPSHLYLGLIIKNISGEQNHLGFVSFRDNFPTIAHFGWKDDFRYEPHTTNDYAMHWLEFIDPENAYPIITILDAIGRDLPFVAGYGITNVGGTRFDEQTGAVIKNPNIDGDSLTCSVFVLCLLEQFGFYIIERSDWDITQQTIEWQKNILDLLKCYLQPEFYQTQLNNIGKYPRFSPEQVLGASCIFEEDSVMYDQACEAASIVVCKLKALDTV